MVCFRYVIVNNVHKGDIRDDDDDNTWIARHKLTIEKCHIEHYTHTSEGANLKVPIIINMNNNITCAINCNCNIY
jgi:flagellar assembly factor FliW